MSFFPTQFLQKTYFKNDISVNQNILSSFDIMTASGYINLNTDTTFFNTYDNYSLDGSQLPLFTLANPIAENNVIQSKILSLYHNYRSGNVKIKFNQSGSFGSFNLTFNYPYAKLLYSNNIWQLCRNNQPPLYVDAQQGTKLVGTGASGNSQQGYSVSLSADGNTLAIGGPLDSASDSGSLGTTWIFTRSGTTWTQQGSKLVGTNFSGNALQGQSVSLSANGNTLAIGGPSDDGSFGATWIFNRSGTTWTQQGSKLVGTGASGNAYQGKSISLSADGNTLAIGSPADDGFIGATWIFTRSGTTWTQQGSRLIGSGNVGNSNQGWSVSLSADGNILAIGGPDDNSGDGATWIFTRSGTTWTQQGAKLVGSGASGTANQGYSVSLSADGNTLAVGGPLNDSNKGATWIFTRSGTTWTQQGNKLIGTNASGNAQQGISVSLSANGNTLAIGGQNDNTSTGATWIFTRSNTIWTQQGNKLVGIGYIGTSVQGYSVSLSTDGNTLAIGGYTDDSNIGATWIFT